jgi:YD repeat-containing protein
MPHYCGGRGGVAMGQSLAPGRSVILVNLMITRVVVVLGVGLLTLPTGSSMVARQSPPPSFESTGLQPNKGYFSQLPFEVIDMITGDLNLRFEDLVLPGSAGMDVRVVRTYSRNRHIATLPGFKWAIGFAGIPRRVIHPTPPQSGEDPFPGYPVLEMSDGSSQRLFPTGHWLLSTVYVGSDYSQFDINSRILTMPNGWSATFEQGNPAGGAALVEIHDPYGNSITPTWGPLPLPANRTQWVITSVLQVTSGQPRTVNVGYPSTTQRTVTYDDGVQTRTWTYELNGDFNITSVAPPTGPGWSFDYSNGLKVTTASGGWVQYTFAEQVTSTESPPTSLPVMVVTSRTTGGPSIEPWSGSFSFDFNARIGQVFAPNNVRLQYRHTWQPGFQNWAFDRKWVFENGIEVSRYESDPIVLGQGGQIVPAEERIIQASRTYTTSYQYSANDLANHWGNLGRASTVTETGDLTRVTTRTFDYNFSTGPGNYSRIASLTVNVGGESFTSSGEYEDTTGFQQSKTEAGVTVTFGRDGDGNPNAVTDAIGHQSSLAYQWGAPASITTPEATVTRHSSRRPGRI